MFESRGVALGVVASVFTLVVGYLVGQATSVLPPPLAGVAARDERLTASEARSRSGDFAFRDAQITGLTVRLGGGLAPWSGVTSPHERPSQFYADLQDARVACGLRTHVVGVECSEPPCIALLRQVEGDVPAAIAACASWAEVLPQPRIDVSKVACTSGREEVVLLVSPAAGERAPEVAAAEDARLEARRAAIREGWRCTQSVKDVAH